MRDLHLVVIMNVASHRCAQSHLCTRASSGTQKATLNQLLQHALRCNRSPSYPSDDLGTIKTGRFKFLIGHHFSFYITEYSTWMNLYQGYMGTRLPYFQSCTKVVVTASMSSHLFACMQRLAPRPQFEASILTLPDLSHPLNSRSCGSTT